MRSGFPVAWGSVASCLQLEEKNGNEGDGFSLNVNKNNVGVSVYVRDKGKFWVIVSIKVTINLEFVSKIFRMA